MPSLTILIDTHPQTMMSTPMTLPSLFHALAVQAASKATAHPIRVTKTRFSFFIRSPLAQHMSCRGILGLVLDSWRSTAFLLDLLAVGV